MRQSTKRRIQVALLAACFLGMTALAQAEIRFYKIRKNGQQMNIRMALGTDKPGCHAFPVKRKVHRIAVVNFKHCQLYSTRACEAGSEIPALWKNKPQKEAVVFTPGSQWYLSPDGNTPVQAWMCVRE